MKLNRLTSGMAGNSMIIGLVVLVVIAGVVVYFVSDPARAKIDEQLAQFKDWTPENIAENPTGYLKFCRKECEETLSKLKAREIGLAQRKASLAQSKAKSDAKIEKGEPALGELKAAYRAAETAGAFPLTWRSMELEKTKAQQQILKLHKELEREMKIRDAADAGLRQLANQDAKIDEVRAVCKDKISEIDNKIEMLKIKELTDDLKDELVKMKGVISTAVVDAGGIDDDPKSLDDLLEEDASAIDESEFDAIMNN